jgi:8-oxo-dGTP pyrophosphatase MutT (NUDIX family)
MKSVKNSYGVLCVRYVNNKPEIYMVKKRCTNGYSAFVHGMYANPDDDSEMLELFNQFTIEEKNAIRTMNFDVIWYHMWGRTFSKQFNALKSKFLFNFDNEPRLMSLLSTSKTSNKCWELPKGRKQSNHEREIECAIRECREEANLCKSNYTFIGDYVNESHTIGDIKYNQKLFIAVAKSCEFTPTFGRLSINEISDAAWQDFDFIKGQKTIQADMIYKLCMTAVKKCKAYRI